MYLSKFQRCPDKDHWKNSPELLEDPSEMGYKALRTSDSFFGSSLYMKIKTEQVLILNEWKIEKSCQE